MKKIFILIGLVVTMLSCTQEFPDYTHPVDGYSTTGYFPYQYPVRILVLGNYIYDNSNDNDYRWVVSAKMGGVYENKTERIFNYVVDETLCENAFFENGDSIKPLPKSYYTLSDPNKITIPSGVDYGGITVQFTEDFFNDPDAVKNTYVLPLRLVSALNIDRLLQGKASVSNPDRRIAGHWSVAPKDFTMFGVKFVNPYHGNYLMRGKSIVRENGVVLEKDSVYQAKHVEKDLDATLTTISRTSVKLHALPFKSKVMTGEFELVLNFASGPYDTQGGVTCTVAAPAGAAYTATGTGKYTVDGGEFGGKMRDLIEVTYTVSKEGKDYIATDRFVFRDKGVKLETYEPTIIIP